MSELAQIAAPRAEPETLLARAEAMSAAWDRAAAGLMRRDYAECDRELARLRRIGGVL